MTSRRSCSDCGPTSAGRTRGDRSALVSAAVADADADRVPGGSRLAWGQEAVDPRQHRAVAGLDPLVLSLVVIPRADDEQLGEQLRIVQITMQVPVHRPGPPAQPPQLDRRRQKLLIGPGRKSVA